MIELDDLDRKAAEAFPGHIVRKDLVRRFRGQFPVPTYVVEFMLGRYCASTVPEEIEEGLQMVQSQLSDRTVRAGEEELFKSKARDRGSVRIIDIITARLDAKTDSYLATLPSLRLNDVRISDKIVLDHERMLTGGFYAEIELGYDASIAQEKGGRPFEVLSLREIQLSTRDILDKIAAGALSPNHAAQLYTAACVVTGDPTAEEAGFLGRLAARLGIAGAHAAAIRAEAKG